MLALLASEQRLMVDGDSTGGAFSILEGIGQYGHATPRHMHRIAEETFVVLEGDLMFEADGDIVRASNGHVIVLPRRTPHSFVVASSDARYLTIHTPSGFESFVRDVTAASRDGSIPDRGALTAIAGAHDIEILGPGITVDDSSRSAARR